MTSEEFKKLKEKKSTMEEILNEADEKNKKEATIELIALGDRYLDFLEQVEEAKLSMKDIVDNAIEKGITKEMIISYCTTKTLTEFNKKIFTGFRPNTTGKSKT